MGFKGTQRESYCYAAASQLERNRLVTLNLTTDVASYATYGSKADGFTTQRAASTTIYSSGYLVTVYPIASRDRTFFVDLALDATKGAPLFPVANGKAVKSSYSAVTRGIAAQPSLSADAIYLLPATVSGTQWSGHANAVYIYTHTGTVHTFIDVDSTTNLGLTVYVTDEKKYYTWNGTAWVRAYSCGVADDAGVSGATIPCINIDQTTQIINSDVSSNFGIFLAGQYSGNPGGTSVTILDARVAAGDKVFCQFQGGTTAAYVVSAVATAGTITLTLSANSGANALISWFIVRQLA